MTSRPIHLCALLAICATGEAADVQLQLQLNGRQLQIQGGQIFLGGNMVVEEEVADASKTAPDPAGNQVIELADGSSLHGSLDAIDSARQEVAWRRADVSGPLSFPMPLVSRVTFAAGAVQEGKAHATVKFTGGDWIAADVVGMPGSKVQLRLSDGALLAVDRAKIEWIYFSKTAAPECYDGPTSLAGWTTDGGWVYRDGALQALSPTPIGRRIDALPDQVEYFFEVEQTGALWAFTVMLHGQSVVQRGFGPGNIQLMLRGSELRLWTQMGNEMKTEQVDLNQALRAPGELGGGFKPERTRRLQCRVLEDHSSGRFIVFINGRKAADWNIGAGRAGENRGGFTFQPMTWSAGSELALTRLRVEPWDGVAIEAEGSDTDRVSVGDGQRREGRLEAMTADKIKLRTRAGLVEWPREKVTFVRFARPKNPAEEDAPVARVRLAQRGEFDATALSLRDGKLKVRTSFCGEMALAPAALREVEFLRLAWSPAKTGDAIIFKNGDQLRGLMDSASAGGKLRWRPAPADAPVEVETARVAGVLFAPREAKPVKSGVVARFRNGDTLTGEFVTLDKEQLVLETPQAGQLKIARGNLQALYFSATGRPAVFDGASERDVWESGIEAPGSAPLPRTKRTAPPSAWNYFDGSYSVARPRSAGVAPSNAAGPSLGRIFDGLAERAEVSFDVTSHGADIFFTAQVFSEPDQPGYMLQFQPQGIFFYDMRPQQRARGVMQQQFQFGENVGKHSGTRHIRLLADRASGRLAIFVDGALVGNVGQKIADGSRNLGRGLVLSTQPQMPCTFSDLWVGPWNGQLPGKAPAPIAPDTVLLANGDEAQGTVALATPTVVKLDSEVGPIDLPIARLTMINFGGDSAPRRNVTRLRLADRGALTVTSYRVENDSVLCQSELAGELRLPLAAVQEMVLSQRGTGNAERGN